MAGILQYAENCSPSLAPEASVLIGAIGAEFNRYQIIESWDCCACAVNANLICIFKVSQTLHLTYNRDCYYVIAIFVCCTIMLTIIQTIKQTIVQTIKQSIVQTIIQTIKQSIVQTIIQSIVQTIVHKYYILRMYRRLCWRLCKRLYGQLYWRLWRR